MVGDGVEEFGDPPCGKTALESLAMKARGPGSPGVGAYCMAEASPAAMSFLRISARTGARERGGVREAT